MPIVPLFGHETIRARVQRLHERGVLPHSILLHGRRGIGKQRFALWLAEQLVCERSDHAPATATSRAMAELRHPDVYWFYPRPRLKGTDPDADDVLEDYGEATAERVERSGLYAPSSGAEGLYLATVKTIVQRAGLAPALAARKVFIVGDAERMISQEGADQAANAFLKLLEEPPADTTIILTSSEPGALLPTIRSRVVAFRMAPLHDDTVRAFLQDPLVTAALDQQEDIPSRTEDRVSFAAGAPGLLMAGTAWRAALDAANNMIDAAAQRGAQKYEMALAQGAANARGAFSDTLEALNVVLHNRARTALARGDTNGAYQAGRNLEAIAQAQAWADGNVSPQLIAARLMQSLARTLS